MMRSTVHNPTAERTLRAVAAAVLLTMLVGGIPIALLMMGADPRILIPDQWPSSTDVRRWPDQAWHALRFAYQDGSLVRAAMLIILWGTWLLLAWMVATEIVVQLRDGAAAARRFSPANPRRWIAGLVAAILVVISSGAATAFPTLGPRAVAAVPHVPASREASAATMLVTYALHGADGHVTTEHRELVATEPDPSWLDPTIHPELPSITVVHGDTMWDLARIHLGEGRRFTEIAELNRDRIPDPNWLQPGWVLLLPADAVNITAALLDLAPGTHRVVVQPGDTLSAIALREYGDPNAWPKLFNANHHRPQPDGRALRDPHMLLPGWIILVPADAPVGSEPPDEQRDPPVTTQPPPNDPSPHDQQPVPPQPGGTSTPATPSEKATSASPSTVDESNDGQSTGPDSGLDLVTGAFVSITLATAISAAVFSARMWRRRRYRIGSGDRGDLKRPTAPVVRALHTAGERHDAAGSIVSPRPAETVSAGSRSRPRLTAMDPTEAGVRVAPPSGIRDGQEIAIDLASTRGLGLLGPGAAAAARALLLHLLGTRAQPDRGVRILVPATDLDVMVDGTNTDRIPSSVLVVESLDVALDEMEAVLLTRIRHFLDKGYSDSRPGALVLLGRTTEHAERRLTAILDNGSTFGLTGILLGQWAPGATVRVGPDGTVIAASPNLEDRLVGTRLFTLPVVDASDLLAVLRDAEGSTEDDHAVAVTRTIEPSAVDAQSASGNTETAERSNPRTFAITQPAPGAQDVDSSAPTNTDPAIRQPPDRERHEPDRPKEPQPPQPLLLEVLGRVGLVMTGGSVKQDLTAALTPKQREVLVYLALHPQGVRREALNDAIWPDSRPPRPFNSLHNSLSLLRRALSNATDGAIIDLVLNDDGRYHLDGELVATDYGQFRQGLQAPRPDGSVDDALAPLREAIELYQGDLAEDLTAAWIEPFRESIRRDVLDALGVLMRSHGDNDPETVLALLERARKLDRYNESVYCDIMRIQARLGQYDAIHRTLALLTTTLDDIGQQPAGDTLNLAEFLQRRGSTRRSTPSDNAEAS